MSDRYAEKHWSVREIAECWNVSEQHVRKIFEPRDDVLKFRGPSITGRRKYVTIRVPESVVARVHNECSGGVLTELKRRRGAVK